MRGILILYFFCLPLNFLFAGNEKTSLFHLDEQLLKEKFSALEEIELKIISGEFYENKLPLEFNSANWMYNDSLYDPHYGIPPFVWGLAGAVIGTSCFYVCMYGGCLFGPAVIGYTRYETDKDKLKTRQAALGCIAGNIIGAAINVAFFYFFIMLDDDL